MIQNLVERGSTFSASGLFMNTVNMMITSNSLLQASKKILLDKEKEKVEREQAKLVEVQDKIDMGLIAYISFAATRHKPKAGDLKNMLSALLVMTESKDCISHYKNKAQYLARLNEIENWEAHFTKRMPSASTSETQAGDTSAVTTSETEIALQSEESSVP